MEQRKALWVMIEKNCFSSFHFVSMFLLHLVGFKNIIISNFWMWCYSRIFFSIKEITVVVEFSSSHNKDPIRVPIRKFLCLRAGSSSRWQNRCWFLQVTKLWWRPSFRRTWKMTAAEKTKRFSINSTLEMCCLDCMIFENGKSSVMLQLLWKEEP